MELVSVRALPSSSRKKLVARFRDRNGSEFSVKFGARGYADYTTHKDKERRSRYWQRHRKDLNTGRPWMPGYLSFFVLWNKKTVGASVDDYKRRLRHWNNTGYFPISHKWRRRS